MAFWLFGRDPVPGLRKKYDRIREKADRIKDKDKKLRILRLLDQVEPTLIALEEQDQPRFERRRMASYVRDAVEQANDMLAEKERKA